MKRICVFCGSSKGRRAEYATAAADLAQAMVERDIDLVYGGASIGIMGAVADAVLDAGGKVYGVIPEHLQNYEIAHNNLTQLHVVADMHERKAKMADLSDGFIAMPGGIGTLEELIEICTWQQLALHNKPCAMLNVMGYFDKLGEFLLHCQNEGFLLEEHRLNLLSEAQPGMLLDAMQQYIGNAGEQVLKIPDQ
jgi:uncharacterized protein (TIGR00730 family)